MCHPPALPCPQACPFPHRSRPSQPPPPPPNLPDPAVITEAAEGTNPFPYWPSPTVSELLTVAERFCAMEWATVHGKFGDIHDWSYPEQVRAFPSHLTAIGSYRTGAL